MSKHDRFRMLHVECSGDVISVLRRVQLSKHYLAHISLSLWCWPGTSAFTLTLPKGWGFWSEPTRFPPPSSNFIAKWNSIHWVRVTLGFAFINEMTTLCWALLGSGAVWWVWRICPHSPEADILVKEIMNKETNEYCRKVTLATSWSLTWQMARGGKDHPSLPYLMNNTAHSNWKWGWGHFSLVERVLLLCLVQSAEKYASLSS